MPDERSPVLCIYREGDEFFATRLDFANRQESPVVWIKPGIIEEVLRELTELAADKNAARFNLAKQRGEKVVKHLQRKRVGRRGGWG